MSVPHNFCSAASFDPFLKSMFSLNGLVAIATAFYAIALTADAQSTVCRQKDHASGSDESIRGILEEHDRRLQTMHESLSSAIEKVNGNMNALLENMNESLKRQKYPDNFEDDPPVVYDCSDVKASGNATSGVHRLYVYHQKKRYYADAYCNMTAEGGRSWTVFQRRKDGSEEFYRGWNDYAHGFGTPKGEFWLGTTANDRPPQPPCHTTPPVAATNDSIRDRSVRADPPREIPGPWAENNSGPIKGNEFLHLLTTKRKYRLRIDLEDFEGNWRFSEYSTFSITSAADKYRLIVGGYSGNAGNKSFSFNDGRQFSTRDSDNDRWESGNSAVWHHGAWWYDHEARSNLNGLYLRGDYSANCSSSPSCEEGIWWKDWHGPKYSLKTTEMKISSSDV